VPPGLTLTSGYEEESIFAIYRSAHDEPVYQDTTRIPYSSAYFNWLFYAATAAPLKPLVVHYGDAVIPRAARAFTAVGSLIGLLVLWRFGRSLLPGQPLVTFVVALAVFLSPLIGWWAHTVRPDVWALVCEATAIVILLACFRNRPAIAIMAGVLLFYAAWAFKPTYVFGLASMIVFLLLRRRFLMASMLVVGSVVLWATTYAVLGAGYRAAMHDTATTNVFLFGVGWSNFRSAVEKSAPLLLLTTALGFGVSTPEPEQSSSRSADVRLFAGVGLVLTTLLSFVASCKIGAASNYFFTPLLMLALLAFGQLVRRPTHVAVSGFLLLTILLQLLVFSGKAGRIDLRPAQAELAIRWAVWEAQPEPRFSADTRLNLPWLSPGSPPLVLAYNYPLHRAIGRKFEADGVGGLITRGYFAALLLPEGDLKQYDGGELRAYRKERTVAGMSLYLRDPNLPAFAVSPDSSR
jgi:hypothetical protein